MRLSRSILACALASLLSAAASAHQAGDRRFPVDRLDARHNPRGRDYAFLNAVGAIWTDGFGSAAAGRFASSAFLIDRCHVLTSMHAVYRRDAAADDAVGFAVAFGVGQTQEAADRGAVQGLKYVLHGRVIGHGHTPIVAGAVADPGSDWAMVQLAEPVDSSVTPLPIAAPQDGDIRRHAQLSSAGFPTERRALRTEGFKLQQLWVSDGELLAVVPTSVAAAGVETTLQTTPGDSGAPVYMRLPGHGEVVVGIVQGMRGNGIDLAGGIGNFQLLFTPATLSEFALLLARTPCAER